MVSHPKIILTGVMPRSKESLKLVNAGLTKQSPVTMRFSRAWRGAPQAALGGLRVKLQLRSRDGSEPCLIMTSPQVPNPFSSLRGLSLLKRKIRQCV